MKKILILCVVISMFVACAPIQQTTTIFDEELTARLMQEGEYSILGSALARKRNGEIVSCAGRTVELLPVTEYSDERMKLLYGNNVSGFNSRNRIVDPPAAYLANIKTTACDIQGFFRFNNLQAGDYYILTAITWEVPSVYDTTVTTGGYLMKRVTIVDKNLDNIVLSN